MPCDARRDGLDYRDLRTERFAVRVQWRTTSVNFTLTVLNPGSAHGMAIPVRQSPFLIGRQPECQLRPNNRKVSGRHCAIHLRDGQALVCDLGSTNGTYVNDELITGERPLRPGDRLRIGPIHFQVAAEAKERPGAASRTQVSEARDLVDLTMLQGLLDADRGSPDVLGETSTDVPALDVRERKKSAGKRTPRG